MCRETSAAQSYYTGSRYAVDNLFRLNNAVTRNSRSRIYLVQPQVAFYINIDSRYAGAPTIYKTVYLRHNAAERRMYVGTHEAACLGDQLAGTHFVAFLNDWHSRSTDMLH